MNDSAEKLFNLRLEHTGTVGQIADAISCGGEDGVLMYLYVKDQKLHAGEIAEALQLTSGRIANILKVLEKKRYIQRKPGQDDKRKILVSLTSSGRSYIAEVKERAVARYDDVLRKLNPHDAATLCELIGRLLERMDEAQ